MVRLLISFLVLAVVITYFVAIPLIPWLRSKLKTKAKNIDEIFNEKDDD